MKYSRLVFQAFMKKVHEARPDFEGQLAYINPMGQQVDIKIIESITSETLGDSAK